MKLRPIAFGATPLALSVLATLLLQGYCDMKLSHDTAIVDITAFLVDAAGDTGCHAAVSICVLKVSPVFDASEDANIRNRSDGKLLCPRWI